MEEKFEEAIKVGWRRVQASFGTWWGYLAGLTFFPPESTIQVQPFHMGGWVQPHQVSTMSFLKVCDLIGHPNG
jgi:hypothetical protein